jgi:hypothetical protein
MQTISSAKVLGLRAAPVSCNRRVATVVKCQMRQVQSEVSKQAGLNMALAAAALSLALVSAARAAIASPICAPRARKRSSTSNCAH